MTSSEIENVGFAPDDPAYAITGWPKKGPCVKCGAPSALLVSTGEGAQYECRGTPTDPRSAYGDDRCGAVFAVGTWAER